MTARAPILRRNRWLLARRTSQFSILGLFLLGPLAGLYWLRGDLASSVLLDTLALTDPFIALQSWAAGHRVAAPALTGAAIVLAAYAVVGGRTYCSWVCPINVVTDAAHWLRERLGVRTTWQPHRSLRLWLMGMVLAVSAIGGTLAWELVNPITFLQRGLVFGLGAAWVVVAAVFLFDLFVSRRGWCGAVCPVGAFYGLVGRVSLLRVNAGRRSACTDCGDCFRVCPEPHVIAPALKPRNPAASPVILSADCTNCGRCLDVCADDVFALGTRFATLRTDVPPPARSPAA